MNYKAFDMINRILDECKGKVVNDEFFIDFATVKKIVEDEIKKAVEE